MVVLKFSLSPEASARLHDMLSCLAKFSDTVSLEAQKDHISISSLNPSKSGYASFVLGRKFFETFKFAPDGIGRDSKFTCAILNKALLSVFKARMFDARGRDTAIVRCEANVQDSDEQTECRLVIRMICAHGVTKTYQLTYESKEVVHALFDRNTANNNWTVKGAMLKEFAEYFAPKSEQLDIYLEDERVTFLSFTEKVVNSKNEILKMPLKTAVAVSTADFEQFNAQEKLHIVISLKDFKAVVSHAASLNASITAYYSNPGRPLQFTYTHEGLTSNFTLMTAADYGSTPAPSAADASAPPTRVISRAASMAATTTETMQPDRSTEMPPPAKPESRRTNRKLGQKNSNGNSTKAAREEEEGLFVPLDDDSRWEPMDHDNDEESMGWDASVNNNDMGFQPTFRDTQSVPRAHTFPDEREGLPPTQRVSQIRGLW